MESPGVEPISDAMLLDLYVRSDDSKAFDRLFQNYRRLVFSAGKAVLGNDDLAQDVIGPTFLLLARHAKGLRNRKSVAGWLCDTASLVARNVKRHEESQMKKLRIAGKELKASYAMSSESAVDLDCALAQLPNDLRKAILLKFVQGMTYAEVGDALHCSEDAARQRVRRSLDALSQRLALGGWTVSAEGLQQAFSQIDSSVGQPEPWLSRHSKTVADRIERAKLMSRLAYWGSTALVCLAIFGPVIAYGRGRRLPAQVSRKAPSLSTVLPYALFGPSARVPVLASGFTLVYDEIARSEGSPDAKSPLTISSDGKTLMEMRNYPGTNAKFVTLIRGDKATIIIAGQTVPIPGIQPSPLVTFEMRIDSIDPDKEEWLAQGRRSQAPPLTRMTILTNLPPVGASYANRLLATTLDGSYSWFMGGGIPTVRDMDGNLNQFGAYDTTYRLSGYRAVGAMRIAGHVEVKHSNGDFRGPNDYTLVSAKDTPLTPIRYEPDYYIRGQAFVANVPRNTPYRGETRCFVPTSTPATVRQKIRAYLETTPG